MSAIYHELVEGAVVKTQVQITAPGLIFGGKSRTASDMSEDDAIVRANAAYYRAFAGRDIAEMSRIWADGDVSCIHPGWPALIGREAVLQSYRNILANPNQEPVMHRHVAVMIDGNEGRVLCVETVGGGTLAATNWFRRIDDVWRMIHHQASPIAVAFDQPKPSSQRLN